MREGERTERTFESIGGNDRVRGRSVKLGGNNWSGSGLDHLDSVAVFRRFFGELDDDFVRDAVVEEKHRFVGGNVVALRTVEWWQLG